jgi:hypothetical protein
MTDKEILYKAILETGANKETAECISTYKSNPCDYRGIIFSHDFAKAFWGEEEIEIVLNDFGDDVHYKYLYCDDDIVYISLKIPAWEYHIQQMVVLSDNEKMKYLEKFL